MTKSEAQQQFQKIEEERNTFLNELSKFSSEAVNKKPNQNAWSALDVVEHLIKSEHYSLKYIEKKMSFNPSFKKSGLKTNFRYFIVKISMWSPFSIKAPVAVSQFSSNSDFEDLKSKWASEREKLKLFLESFPSDLLDKEVYKHPAVGKITVPQMLKFFSLHCNRHKKQAFRTLGK